jgi:hypothetical protein
VSGASGKVAEIRALTSAVRTPFGLQLGMLRSEVARVLPAGALPNNRRTVEVFACTGDRASTVELEFNASGHLARLVLNGYYPVQ